MPRFARKRPLQPGEFCLGEVSLPIIREQLDIGKPCPYVAFMPSGSDRSNKRKSHAGAGPRSFSPSTVRPVKAAKARLLPIRFASGARSGPVEISPRLTSKERAAVEFWIQRMPEAFARQLFSSRGRPLKIAVADRLISNRGCVFINQEPPPKRVFSARMKHSLHGSQPHAVSFIPELYIVLERGLFRRRIELGRILYHELCHFLWPRLGNPRRRRFQNLIRRQLRERVGGELGYSSGMRKTSLLAAKRGGISRQALTRLQRDYFCESFCDTGAYVLLGSERSAKHSEFTLSRAARERRKITWEAVVLNCAR